MKKATVKTGLKIALVAGGVLALVPTVYGQGIGTENLERMTAGTPQQIDRGAQVFDDQCASCHGDNGQGGAEVGQRLGAQGFVDNEVERSGLYSIYDVVSRGFDYEGGQHPVFENLYFQDQWAVSHYVHNLIDDPQPDPEALVERVRRESIEGVCNPEIRAEIAALAEPEGEDQLARGAELYGQNCVVCHGEQGLGDGPGANTDPPARDFSAPVEDWTNGTSPSAVFNTLDQGIEGTGMAAFGHLPEEDVWAMVHYVREEFVPPENQEEMSEEEIDSVCRSLSAPPRPEPIPVERAIEFLAQDADEQRMLRYREYGAPIIHSGANRDRGQQLYDMACASCHGTSGQPDADLGPYGSFPPYLTFRPSALEPAAAGGTFVEVAQRAIAGPHATLPDMTPVATFSRRDWQDVQAYLSGLEGQGARQVEVLDYDNVDASALERFSSDVTERILAALEDRELAEELSQELADAAAEDADEEGDDEDANEEGEDADDDEATDEGTDADDGDDAPDESDQE